MSLATMRFCYQIIIIFTLCLTVTLIALTYEKCENVLKRASIYLPLPWAFQRGIKSNLSPRFNKAPRSLSDLEFYPSYHVRGFLRLVTSNLNEPIEVWYNKEHKQSRIDYYDGDVKTYQDGNLSLFIKIIPKYDSIKNIHTIGCWKKRKKQGGRIGAQNILPTSWSWPFKGSLEDFKVSSSSRFDSYKRKDHQTIVVSTQKMPYIGDDIVDGRLCMKWRYEHNMMGRNNVYTYWVEKRHPPAPVRYEMIGYDTLLTSYYDKYIIDYSSYEEWEYEKDVFDIPEIPGDSGCWNASQEQNEEGEYFMNPIAEFISPHDRDEPIENKFHQYRTIHGKDYNDTEHLERKHIFRHNTRFIDSVNRKNLTFKLKPNSFTDMTESEYNLHKGHLPDHPMEIKPPEKKRRKKLYISERYKPHRKAPRIPDELDWRKYGAVSKPRGQSTCGSCWAFAAIGAIEGANFIKTGKLVQLSEQQMVDCTWKVKGVWNGRGNNGCHGGTAWKVMFWGKTNTIATSESYGPYRGQEGYCKTENITAGAKIYGFRRVKRHSAQSLRRAIAYHGPASVAINSHLLTLKFYSHGILDDKDCGNGTDHAVLVVGYGKENGVNYWIVKNSWSTLWGDKGYVKIKEDLCGILNKPVIVLNRHIKSYPWHRKRNERKHFSKWHKKSKRKRKYRKIKGKKRWHKRHKWRGKISRHH